MADVQPEHGTAPIAYAILEAMAKDSALFMPAQIMLWVLRNTYGRRIAGKGPRRKTCAFTWTKIAEQIRSPQHRNRVSKVGRALIESKRLYIDAKGFIGIQKDYDVWETLDRRGFRAHSVRAHSVRAHSVLKGGPKCRKGGPTLLNSQNAREVLSVQSEPKGSLTRNPRPQILTLPNGKADTMQNRAELGDIHFEPRAHPAYKTADWAVQREVDYAFDKTLERRQIERQLNDPDGPPRRTK